MRLNRSAGLAGMALALVWALVSLPSCGGGSGSSSGGGGNTSAGHNAYMAIPEANAVASFRVDGSSGNLKSVLGSPFLGGTSPISIAVHPSGKFIYAANQGSNDISLFNIDSNSGELTEVLPRTPAGLNPTFMVMDSGGTLIFVANQTSNNISVYSISASDGTLTAISGSPFPTGARPVTLALAPSGKFLYVGSGNLAGVFGSLGGCGSFVAGSRLAFCGGKSAICHGD